MYVPSEQRYESIEYRRCGRSGLRLPLISLGLWHNFGGPVLAEESRRMVLRSFDLGITHFDLGNNYGPPPGRAEEHFGGVMKSDLAAHRDEIIVSTKAGYRMWPGPYGEWGSRKSLLASLDQSLKRMGLDYVDIFYSHRFDPDTPLEETMSALETAVRQGKALYVGVSSYSGRATAEAERILNGMGLHCLIHQPSYSMFNRWIESDLLPVLREKGIGCITFSPLAQGLLSEKYLNGIPGESRAERSAFFRKKSYLTQENLDRVKALNDIAKRRGQSLAQMAIAWNARHEEVTSVLIGASSVAQIEENAAALKNTAFSAEELAEIDRYAVDTAGINLWAASSNAG